MEKKLDLTRHCIQTAIKRLHEKALSDFFAARIDENTLEETLSFAQLALNHLDFSFLRSQYPPLAGGSDATVILSMNEAGQMTLSINGSHIEVKWRGDPAPKKNLNGTGPY